MEKNEREMLQKLISEMAVCDYLNDLESDIESKLRLLNEEQLLSLQKIGWGGGISSKFLILIKQILEEKRMPFEKQWNKKQSQALQLLHTIRNYDSFSYETKQIIFRTLEQLDRDTLGFMLEELSEGEFSLELLDLVEDLYVGTMVSNEKQFRFLKESLNYKREDRERMSQEEYPNIDLFNKGKHCDKFGRRKSGKKAKGKAYARVRVKEINLN